MVEVKRRENESIGGLLRRFTRKIQRSGVLIDARATQYRGRIKSEFRKKKEALRRIKWQKEMERLRKLGKVE
jgi:ribosomal protein S21